MGKKENFHELIENSIRLGTQFAEIALVFKDKEAAKIANTAYANAIRGKIALLLEIKLSSMELEERNYLLLKEREDGTTTSE